jgi:hypothetical protein
LSIQPFAFGLNPFLWLLDQTLTRTRNDRAKRRAVVAYADIITLLVTALRDIPALDATLPRHEKLIWSMLDDT